MTHRGISKPAYIGLLAVQWVMLTLAHSAVLVYAGRPLERYVTPHIGDGWIIVSGIVAGLLLGIAVRSIPALLVLAFLLAAVSASIYGLVIYSPSLMGIIARAVVFQNYASQQAFFIGLWSLMPVLGGALVGQVAGGSIRRAAFPDPDAARLAPWWETNDSGTRDPGPGTRESS